ncbi:ATP-binding protein [Mucilaginibacter sp. AK015]|uniref:ATP-binding protein n=1 Tax=Mucilaginibacter sp. AK015 TaxID=2723072 RepID=UPI00161D3E4E|nr:ATP-binding protein [Mucilaginibacter sp. AK015]MBB5397060.1 signal transduction histidine kinase/ActR/RegA family two-component response regulator [Mucilaginibacter sp. AK015]
MDISVPFFNFSIKKVLALQPDNLKRARIKIVCTILLLSLLKIAIILPLVYHGIQPAHLYRIIIVFVLYAGLLKYLLYRPDDIDVIAHLMILIGLVGIWVNLIVIRQSLNLVTLQFVFMITFVGYYLINSRHAIVYSFFAIAPVMYYLLITDRSKWYLDGISRELPSPGFEIIVVLNFITIVLIHYLFYRAFRDNVAEKEILNKQLQATIAETKALAESRSVFLSTMSHELRTPLNAVIGMTSLIKDTATPEQTENLDILEFSAVSLLTLVNDILDYNKGENDKIVLEAIPVHLPVLLHKVCSGLQQKASEKGFHLILDVDPRLKEHWVVTDPTRLTQIIYNLAGNAIKFTESGQVSVNATVNHKDEDHLTINFSVADTGIGIPADRQGVIFDPFMQASADTTRHYGGTGLGLAIVKRLLGLFNSAIELTSQENKGSVFSFTIKFELYKGNVNPISLHTVMNTSLEGLNVLIAEDNRVNAQLLVKLLTKWQINAVIANNGQEAIDKLSAQNFDVVLMDLHMPLMDGYQATQAIRLLTDSSKAQVPIIALTASVSHNIHDKIKEAGMHDYLSKPFQAAALYQKLEALNAAKQGKVLAG